MNAKPYDVLILGGGINGAGIARDAAGRGLKVALCEKADLGWATSSASTKLVHGGLRYLEYYEFRLVREALREREMLMRAAPHLVRPMRFVLPHMPGLRPVWMIRAGLFLYDHLGGRERLPGSRAVNLRQHIAGTSLNPRFHTGFIYSDCQLDDSRMVVGNALDAKLHGADILPRTELTAARREGRLWSAVLRDAATGDERLVTARALVNAAGPWARQVIDDNLHDEVPTKLRLVQGSHIVVDRLYEHPYCFIFQNPDGRIIFSIPYEGRYTLIGTTDREYHGDPGRAAITPEEVDYLCSAINTYLRTRISPADVRWTFSGVRPLIDDGASQAQSVTRDYVLKLTGGGDQAVGLHIFGGKITTYRRLAETVLAKVCPHLGCAARPWTESAPLPGGDMEDASFDCFMGGLSMAYPDIDRDLLRRLGHCYGTRTYRLLGQARTAGDLGEDLGVGFTEAEAQWLMDEEWATTADDMLWRRTKMGLPMTPAQRDRVDAWVSARAGGAAPVRPWPVENVLAL